MDSVLGIVGGSGLYDLADLDNARWEYIESPWGEPSDAILFAYIHGLPIRFLPRHGRGHRLGPGDINYRANIDALKRAGVTDLVSFSACGSLAEQYPPGHLTSSLTERRAGTAASSERDALPTCPWRTR